MLDALVHTLADKEYYAPPATTADPGPRFAPTRVPSGWWRVDRDIWTVWSDGQARRAEQGWKIHISARLDRAQHVLDTVAEICFAEGVLFKHVSARTFFMVLHHKHAGRPQAGKFCAIYPPDTETARRLLGLLSDALREEDGPYILPDGTRQGLVRDGFGRDVPDERLPYFVLPDGIADPFVAEEPEPHQGSILIRDYEIAGALQPSNAGGAYLARDTRTGRRVFIKEARAHNGLTMDGTDAQTRLRHEYEVLTAVHAAAPGICPEPLDHFREWEHDFLVTEYVEGVALRAWLSSTSSLIRTGSSAADHAVFFDAARRVLAALGHLDEAIDLAEHAKAHSITASCSTLAGGRAGVGLTWLARAMPYLAVGAAGVGTALSHYGGAGRDERLREALPKVAAGTTLSTWTKEAGLYEGLAGLSWFLTHYAEAGCHADPDSILTARANARRAATGLLKYAVPHTRGVRFLGSGAHRFSADLSGGGAGVLPALRRFLDGPGDEVFTLSPAHASTGASKQSGAR